MSAVESALDVLSRAATMVQEERPKATSLHRKPSSVWRKERRRDPIQSEALDMTAQARAQQQHQNQQHNGPSRPSVIVPTTAAPKPGLQSPEATTKFLTGTTTENTAVTPTASVTPSAATRGQPDLHHPHQQGRQSNGHQQRSGMRTAGVQASDPAIDEHFKRSLGLKDYAAVFDAVNANDKDAGLSVDDHFAKALGETWTKLQATSRSKDAT